MTGPAMTARAVPLQAPRNLGVDHEPCLEVDVRRPAIPLAVPRQGPLVAIPS